MRGGSAQYPDRVKSEVEILGGIGTGHPSARHQRISRRSTFRRASRSDSATPGRNPIRGPGFFQRGLRRVPRHPASEAGPVANQIRGAEPLESPELRQPREYFQCRHRSASSPRPQGPESGTCGSARACPSEPVDLDALVEEVVARAPFVDVHTHLFPSTLAELQPMGHRRSADVSLPRGRSCFCVSTVRPQAYWALPKSERADLVWRTLSESNRRRSPEATRGVVSALHMLGLDPASRCLGAAARNSSAVSVSPTTYRRSSGWPASAASSHDQRSARRRGDGGVGSGARQPIRAFTRRCALDRIVNDWEAHHHCLEAQGYNVTADRRGHPAAELRRFLTALVAALQLRATWPCRCPTRSIFRGTICRTCCWPAPCCPPAGISSCPIALMIGVRRQVNSALQLAGDACGRADLRAVGALCSQFPENRFMVSVLQPREPARAVRLRAQVRQPPAVRLLVVREQRLPRRGDHDRTAGNARHELHSAALGRAGPGAAALQVAGHAEDPRADSGECVQARRRGTAGRSHATTSSAT